MKKLLKFKNYVISIVISFIITYFVKMIFIGEFYILLPIFIGIYFLCLYLLKRKVSFNKKEIIFTIVISLLFSVAFFPIYSVPKQNINIKFIEVQKPLSEEFYNFTKTPQSLKICDVKSGPFSVNIEKLYGRGCVTLNENFDNLNFAVTPGLPITVTYNTKSNGAYPLVTINNKTFLDDTLNTKVSKIIHKKYENVNNIYPFYKSFIKFGIVFISLSLIMLIFIKLIKVNKKFIYGLITFNILFLSKMVNLTNTYCIFLLALFLFITFLIIKFKSTDFIKKYYSKKSLIMFLIVDFIITFMCVGYELFMATESVFEFSFYSITYFLVTFVCAAYVIFGILLLFDNFKLKKKKSFNKSTFVFLITFLVLSISFIIFSSIFYPGLISVDSNYSWMQASLYKPFDDFHPTFYSFFLYIFAIIFNNPFAVIVFQNIASALIISLIIRELYLKGVESKTLILIVLMFLLIPNIMIEQATMWKDIPFTISLLVVTYLMYKLYMDEKSESKNILFLLVFSIFLVFLLQFRYNGIIAVILIFIYLIFKAVRTKNIFLGTLVIFTILLNMFTTFVINEAFNVKEVNVNGVKYTSIIKNFAATLYYGEDLNKEANNKLEELFPKEAFVENYSGTNIDKLYNMEKVTIDHWLPVINNYSMLDIIPIYIKNIISHPAIFLRDKLDGMNILFNLNPKYYEPIFGYYIGFPYTSNVEEKKILESQIGGKLESVIDQEEIKAAEVHINNLFYSEFQNLFYRAAFPVALLLVLFLYFFICKRKSVLVIYLPLIGYTLSWFIALNHQSFRYIYYMNFIFIFVILLALIIKEKKNDN